MFRRIASLVALGLFLAQGMSASAAQPNVYLPLVYGRPTVRVVEAHAWGSGACAELVNHLPYAIRTSRVWMHLLDSDGEVVATATGQAATRVLGPGQHTVALLSNVTKGSLPPYASLRVQVIWEPASESEVFELEVVESDLWQLFPSPDYWRVTTHIRNPLDVTVGDWDIGVALYDVAGHLIGAHRSPWVDDWCDQVELAPGEVYSYEFTFPFYMLDRAATPVRCRVYATGWR